MKSRSDVARVSEQGSLRAPGGGEKNRTAVAGGLCRNSEYCRAAVGQAQRCIYRRGPCNGGEAASTGRSVPLSLGIEIAP